MVICYTVPKIWCMTDVIVIFHFGLFLAFYSLLTAQKIKTSKNEKIKKKMGDIIILHMCIKNYD